MTTLLKSLNLSLLALVTLVGIGSLSAQDFSALQSADMSGGDSGVDWSISGDFFGFGSVTAAGTEALIQLRAVNSTDLTVGDITLYFTTDAVTVSPTDGTLGFAGAKTSSSCTLQGLAAGLSGPIGVASAPTSIGAGQEFQEDTWTAIACSINDPSFMAGNNGSDFFVTLGLTGSGAKLFADTSADNKTRLDIFTPTTSAVPEPATLGFGLVTLAAIGFRQYKRNKNVA